jgi:hypothetical protein
MFFNLIITDGMTGGFNESGINSNAFIDGNALAFELAEDFGVYLIHGFFRLYIPVIPDGHSGGSRTVIPDDGGQKSERSDAVDKSISKHLS